MPAHRRLRPTWIALLGIGLLVKTALSAAQPMIRGHVIPTEGPPLPPGALIDVTLEDQSRTDVAAAVIARSQTIATGAPPYPFRLHIDASALEPGHRYGLRARISAQGQLWYINTSRIPLPEGDSDAPVVVEVEPVGIAKHGGTGLLAPLPALFTGMSICAECGTDGARQIEHLLELDAAGRYVYQREPIPTAAGRPEAEIGRWELDPETMLLTLRGPTPESPRFLVENSHLMARLSDAGEVSDDALELNRAAACTALEPVLSLEGVLAYAAGAPTLTACPSGEILRVAVDGAFPELDHAYRQTLTRLGRTPGSPLRIEVSATLEQRPRSDASGLERTAVIERVIRVGERSQCRAGASAPK